MHFAAALQVLLLPALLVAGEQVPLKDKASGWLDKAKAYIPSAVPIPNPVDAGAAKVAEYKVERVNIRNWERKLGPKVDTEEEWMLYLTGGNKSCFGRCGEVDKTWNLSVPLLAALPRSAGSPPLHLGLLDCEKDEVLCTGWAATMPAIYHFMVPKKSGDAQPKVPLHIVPLNLSSASVEDIVSIPSSSQSRYLEVEEYTGLLHPFDGWLAKLKLITPFGYLMWGIGSVPSWAMMIGISFISRQIMSRRMTGRQAPGAAAGQAQQAQTPNRPAPAPAAPASAPRSGGGKKRK